MINFVTDFGAVPNGINSNYTAYLIFVKPPSTVISVACI